VLLRDGQCQQPGVLEGPPGTVTAIEHVADDGANLVEHRVHADLLRVARFASETITCSSLGEADAEENM
jgi:hypothetical protein